MRLTTPTLLAATLLAIATSGHAQKFEGLALTPPMGWNSWNTFETNIDEALIKAVAQAMIDSGMRDVGYVYINLDDGWTTMERDDEGDLIVDPVKFPSGLKALSDYLHERGFKFGVYNCAGDNDVRSMTPEIVGILTNEEAIAVDQDPLGKQGSRFYIDGEREIWTRELDGGDLAVIVFNAANDRRETVIEWSMLGHSFNWGDKVWTIRDIWQQKDLGTTQSTPRISRALDPHDVMFFRLSPAK